MILSKIENNKLEKQNSIEEAAFELFTTTSFSETSIDQIVKKAKIAKGTFYLYFKDKDQLLHRLVFKLSSSVLREALQTSEQEGIYDHIDRILFLCDYVIEYLKNNKDVLKIINRNLSWSMMGETIKEENDKEIERILNLYAQDMMNDGYTHAEAFQLLYILIELISSVCHSSILLNQPDNIDDLKPTLMKTIRKMLKP